MNLDHEFEVHIPLTGKYIELEALPGQDCANRYGVVWDACQQPDDGLGYVVQFRESRTCRILAWIGKGGTVTECDRPIAFVAPGIPALVAERGKDDDSAGLMRSRRHGSDELMAMVAYRGYFPGQYAFEELQTKGSEGLASKAELERVLGGYAGRRLAWRVFLAVSYLAFYLLPRLGSSIAAVSGTIADVLRSFTEQPLPDAIDSLIFRVMESQEDEVSGSGFERYAARMLQQAGSAGLRQIATRHEMRVSRLSTTLLFWLRFPDDVTEEERAVLLSVEACLNRLALIEAALRARGDSTALADVGESLCALQDRRNLAGVADSARERFGASQEENPYCVYLPANPVRGGEWDIRTRFLRACERLRVPFRLEYRFDADAGQGIFDVRMGVPAAGAFPGSLWNEGELRWEDHVREREARASLYALRLAMLVASCAFGTSLGIRSVILTACENAPTGTPVLSLAFERMSFLNRSLPQVESGAVARIGRDGKCVASHPAELLSLLAPMGCRISFGEDGGLLPIQPLAASLSPSRLALSDDQRTLPSFLAQLLHAHTVRDLDVEATTDLRELDEVQNAIEEAPDSRLLAIARLEELAERNPLPGFESGVYTDADVQQMPREYGLLPWSGVEILGSLGDGGEGAPHTIRFVYFPNLMTRCVAGVIARDDEEEFRPISAVAYRSRSALAKLYAESGDVDAAVARAYECSSLAPTSAGLQFELAQLMLVVKHPRDAVVFLRQALKVCVRQQMATVLYAHLASAFWMCDDVEPALAAFTLARGHAEGATPFDQAIAQLAHLLDLKEAPGIEQAASILRGQGVSLAPSEAARALVISAGVGFTDARMFELAWPLVGAMGMDIGNDVMAMMGEHLRIGLG